MERKGRAAAAAFLLFWCLFFSLFVCTQSSWNRIFGYAASQGSGIRPSSGIRRKAQARWNRVGCVEI